MATLTNCNYGRFLKARYIEGHGLLATDPDAAAGIFFELLHEVQMPLYMRAQCNSILATLADDIEPPMVMLAMRAMCLNYSSKLALAIWRPKSGNSG